MNLPPVRYATASDGTRIAYMRWPGESPPFLAVYTPGSPSMAYKSTPPTDRPYARWFSRFARGRSWVIFDWRGTGLSGPIHGELTNDDLVRDVDAVCEAVGEPVDGWVPGPACGPVCVHAAAKSGVWRSLWLRSPSARIDNKRPDLRMRAGWDLDYLEHLRLLLLSMGAAMSDAHQWAELWAAGLPKESWGAYQRVADALDLSDVLPRVTIPTWITAGIENHRRPAARVAALMPDATLSFWNAPEIEIPLGDWSRDDWDRNLGARLGDVTAPSPNGLPAPDLTSREREILVRLALGNPNSRIARELTLSTRTVERHVQNIYAKLDVHNRVEAANWAREHGVV